jgi:hypothetical protein
VSSAGVARRAKEGIGGSSSRGLFRKWGAQGKSRLTGPESWTLWCADIRSCMLDGVFCVQCVVVYEACRAGQGRALRAGLRRVAGSRQSAGRRLAEGARSRRRANWRCGEGRDRQRSAGQAGAGADVVVRGSRACGKSSSSGGCGSSHSLPARFYRRRWNF